MTDINQAIVDIQHIRRHVAQTSEFRGYGPFTLSTTSAIALLTGAIQSRWISAPATHPTQYVALWLTTGVVCAALIASQMVKRADRLHSGMADEMVRMAVTQFAPAAIAGAVLPFVLLRGAAAIFWLLPCLWQILFSLGVFASARCLPRPMLLAGIWFLCTGFAGILRGPDHALAPATMSIPYAVGMAFVAAVHYFSAKKASVDENSL